MKKNSVLLVPPAPPGSFGDEAILIASINYLLDAGISKLGIISHVPPLQQQHPDLPIQFIDCSDYFEKKDDSALKQFENALSVFDSCLFFGADMMDGYYSLKTTMRRLKLVQIAGSKNKTTAVIGFSFNNFPEKKAVEQFQIIGRSVRYKTQDRISKTRFEKATGLTADLTADPAFLLSPFEQSESYWSLKKFRRRCHSRGRAVLGINPNYMPSLKSKDCTLEDFISFHIDLVTDIIKTQEAGVVLFPHDIRGSASDLAVCRQIAEKLPRNAQKWFTTLDPSNGAAEIKGITGLMDACVCQRMHAAIACLGRGTPCLCITYQDKFEGLLDLFALNRFSLSRAEAFNGTALIEKIGILLQERNGLHRQISEQLPAVHSLAENNFSDVL